MSGVTTLMLGDTGGSGGGGGGGGGVSVPVSPLGASVFYSTSGTKTTNSVTASPSFGTGPYTYAWSRVDGDTTMAATAASAASTAWTRYCGSGGSYMGDWQCLVTDSLGATGIGSVTVTFTSTL